MGVARGRQEGGREKGDWGRVMSPLLLLANEILGEGGFTERGGGGNSGRILVWTCMNWVCLEF